MCGLAGFIDPGIAEPEEVCRRMTRALAHRGPDDSGVWIQRDVGLALGHRRLSILDLSAAGHQPMPSASRRFWIVYNGEIYNHLSIRKELEDAGRAPAWQGHSDTETILAAVEAWGLEATLTRLVGMFSIALWDGQRRRLMLARDRAGEKPLYYGTAGRAFLFGSELKSLRQHPAFRAEVDRGALALYLRHCYVPDPHSIYAGVKKLPAGTYLEVDEQGRHREPVHYWSVESAIRDAKQRPFRGTDAEAVTELGNVLGQAVEGQMIADVPLGAFLSGGIDSSVIVSLMQSRSTKPVRTFTIGFAEAAYNEADHARAVAQHLGTEHTEIRVTPAETRDVIPQLPQIYDEPFGDSSQIPTFLVSQLARRHVTVSLSGDAGDELFGGYTRYFTAKRIWGTINSVPRPLRSMAARVIRARRAEAWSRTLGLVGPLVPGRWRGAHMGERLHKLAGVLETSPAQVYLGLVSHWPRPSDVVVGGAESSSFLTQMMARPSGRAFDEDMMEWDFASYLQGDILVKVDRAGMAVSLESRVPMLDHRVIEFAWSLPLHMKVRGTEGKWILKQLLARYVPRTLTDRPKMGFGVPIDSWLRGPLREWAETLLDEARLRREGFFNPAPVRDKWREHTSGAADWSYWLWDVLMFQAWLEAQTQAFSSDDVQRSAVAV